ncbi:hypothetical protein, partial [Bifidobacterium aquikefiri]|uniref:hypothetical protein n=1 Tax=Bifidobacterium aquikefiri TaxID=1653207 RepID=UPI0039ECB409
CSRGCVAMHDGAAIRAQGSVHTSQVKQDYQPVQTPSQENVSRPVSHTLRAYSPHAQQSAGNDWTYFFAYITRQWDCKFVGIEKKQTPPSLTAEGFGLVRQTGFEPATC